MTPYYDAPKDSGLDHELIIALDGPNKMIADLFTDRRKDGVIRIVAWLHDKDKTHHVVGHAPGRQAARDMISDAIKFLDMHRKLTQA